MRYISFDIESIDGYFAEGTICEFGYVLADDKFNIIKQENILIHPRRLPKKLRKFIDFAYTINDYRNAPKFPIVHDKIVRLLSAPNTVVLGHAVHNDVFCVNSACLNYGLSYPSYKFIDTQIIYAMYKGVNAVQSLGKIAEEIGVEFVHHRADEDARLSLLTLKYVMDTTGMELESLLDTYFIESGINDDGNVSPCRSIHVTDGAPNANSKNSKRRLMRAFIDEMLDAQPRDGIRRKKFYISNNTAINDFELARRVIKVLFDNGYKYVFNPASAEMVICNGNGEGISPHKRVCIEDIAMQYELPELEFDDVKTLERLNEERRRKRMAEARRARIKSKNVKLPNTPNVPDASTTMDADKGMNID